ncbi:uncharacterized protein METZ01_LOCUS290807, partial [marine metagenome]
VEWSKRYEGWEKKPKPLNEEQVIEGLVLVAREWWERFGTLPERGWGVKVKACCYHDVNPGGEKCPFKIQGINKLTSDHLWPNSLGGPEDTLNLLGLCTTHNEAKSSGIECFDFSTEPLWLRNRLGEIAKLHSNSR